MKKKRIAILGSTGSIGVSTLDVIREYPHLFQVVSLSARSNIERFKDQIDEFKPEIAAIPSAENAASLQRRISHNGTRVISGSKSLVEAAIHPEVDLLVSAVVGAVGLEPLIMAIEHGKNIALANKESMVMAGEIIKAKVKEEGIMLLPIDSEHNAIFQCLIGKESKDVGKVILTASGGPFRAFDKGKMASITPGDALKHPTWDMGAKITIDSATLMNKGLELIEAKWFFNVGRDKLDVVIHPESIIHSMVQFTNGSIIAQMSLPDMRHPIAYVLAYPDTLKSELPELHLPEIGKLSFYQPDYDRFPCLSIAFDALDMGNSYSITLNASNEVAVQLFLDGRISFPGIPELIRKTLDSFDVKNIKNLEEILEQDLKAREMANKLSRQTLFQT